MTCDRPSFLLRARLPLLQVLFPSGPQSGVSLLIDKYVQRTAGTLSSWLVNIVEVSV